MRRTRLFVIAVLALAILVAAWFFSSSAPGRQRSEAVSLSIVADGGRALVNGTEAPENMALRPGSVVVLEALPEGSYRFSHWLVNGTRVEGNLLTLTVRGNTTVEAVFQRFEPKAQITVETNVPVKINVSGTEYLVKDRAELASPADPAVVYVPWSAPLNDTHSWWLGYAEIKYPNGSRAFWWPPLNGSALSVPDGTKIVLKYYAGLREAPLVASYMVTPKEWIEKGWRPYLQAEDTWLVLGTDIVPLPDRPVGFGSAVAILPSDLTRDAEYLLVEVEGKGLVSVYLGWGLPGIAPGFSNDNDERIHRLVGFYMPAVEDWWSNTGNDTFRELSKKLEICLYAYRDNETLRKCGDLSRAMDRYFIHPWMEKWNYAISQPSTGKFFSMGKGRGSFTFAVFNWPLPETGTYLLEFYTLNSFKIRIIGIIPKK